MSKDRSRAIAERLWLQMRPQVVDMLVELLENPPASSDPPGDDDVTEADMERIRKSVARKKAKAGQKSERPVH